MLIFILQRYHNHREIILLVKQLLNRYMPLRLGNSASSSGISPIGQTQHWMTKTEIESEISICEQYLQ
jgi:hypothetical protein